MGWYHQNIVPRVLEYTMTRPTVTEHRVRTVGSVRGDILEIGFGTGLNLPFYPKDVKKITIVDDNGGLMGLAAARVAKSGIEIDCRILSAEQLPFPDGRFDTVLSTWTLCSIERVDLALQEVFRVLKPGGRFVFIEHGRHKRSAYVRGWQRFINPTHKILGGNCDLTRDIAALIAGTAFVVDELEEFAVSGVPQIHAYAYRGVCRKPETDGKPT